MKTVYGVVLLASLLALAHSFPGAQRESADSSESEENNDGVVLVIPVGRRQSIFDRINDDDEPSMPGMWHPLRFDNSPFDSLFTRMQDAMNRIRAEMAAALSSRLGQIGGLTPWGKLPEGANTTSTTKVIGDHAVTINETTYTDGDENGGTVFRVRIVDVKPLNETTEAVGTESSAENTDEEIETKRPAVDNESEKNENREELTTQAPRSVETVEEFDNEIPKQQVDTLTA